MKCKFTGLSTHVNGESYGIRDTKLGNISKIAPMHPTPRTGTCVYKKHYNETLSFLCPETVPDAVQCLQQGGWPKELYFIAYYAKRFFRNELIFTISFQQFSGNKEGSLRIGKIAHSEKNLQPSII